MTTSRVVDDDEILEALMGHVLALRQETAVQAPVGQGIEEVLDQGFVADLDRAQEDLQAGPGRPVRLQVSGYSPRFPGMKAWSL